MAVWHESALENNNWIKTKTKKGGREKYRYFIAMPVMKLKNLAAITWLTNKSTCGQQSVAKLIASTGLYYIVQYI